MNYPPPQASALVSLGIASLALLIAALFVLAVARTSERPRAGWVAALGVVAWLGLTAALAASGVLARFDLRPPPFALMFAVVISGGITLGMSRIGKRLALDLPLAWLVGAQAFRLPLELVMHQAAREGVMPVAMSFSGYNFDIITGASALVLAPLIASGRAPRMLVIAWNVLGITLLCVIAAVAFLTTPLLRALGDAPAQVNSWVAYFPFVWLPAVLVLAAIAGHVMVARRLLEERAGERRKVAHSQSRA